MTSNDSSVASDDQFERNETAVFRNGLHAVPDTPSSRANHSLLLRAARDVGYSAIGERAEHDKSWVCRVLSGEVKANIFEWMAILDASALRLDTPNAESAADADLLNALLRKTASGLSREASTVGEGDIRLHADEYRSLLLLAQRGIKSMQEAAL